MTIAHEEGAAAVEPLAGDVGEEAERADVGLGVEGQAVLEAESLPRFHPVGHGPQPHPLQATAKNGGQARASGTAGAMGFTGCAP